MRHRAIGAPTRCVSASAAAKGMLNWASTSLLTERFCSAGSATRPTPAESTPQPIASIASGSSSSASASSIRRSTHPWMYRQQG